MNYEILYIAPNKYSETEIKTVDAKIASILTDNKAAIVEIDHWGKKKLAYPIKHYDYGYYTLIIFSAADDIIAKITEKLNLNQDVIRFQIVKEVKKSPIIKGKKKIKTTKASSSEITEKIKDYIKIDEQKKSENKDKKIETERKNNDKHSKIKIDGLDKKLDELLEETL
ncbi:MAG: 30S ribosomal protein S6 [Patescibacteria group bacterium]|nr:30S ribosomal protein S6 [Patescibacteria group bacterium]